MAETAAAGINLTAESGTQQVLVTRTFKAPRGRVFDVYTDPKLIPQWWGPRSLTTTVDTMEARPGGRWRYLNREPDGREYGFHGVYHDVVRPERIVSTFEFEGVPGHVSLDTVTFEERDGATTVTVLSVFQSIADRDGMLESGMAEGLGETFDRLEELVAQ